MNLYINKMQYKAQTPLKSTAIYWCLFFVSI